MSDAIYAPPEADVEVTEDAAQEFYVVSPTKFFLLSFLTLNLYLVYWFYRNWRIIKVRNGENIWPPMRGLFYIFFTHSLFADVDETLKTKGKAFEWQPGLLATLVVVLTISMNIISRMAGSSIGSPVTDLVWVALLPVLPLLLLKAQRAINTACDDPDGSTNSGFGVVNWIWMVVGGLYWILVLFGTYAIVFAPELLAE